jgi:spore coat protein U-like protein
MSGRPRLAAFCAMVTLSAFAPAATAAITCSVSVTPVSVVYDDTSAVQNVTSGSYTVTCNRAGGDPATYDWQLGVNDGVNFNVTNRVRRSGTQYYSYETYRTYPAAWGDADATVRFTGTINFGGALTASMSGPFDIVMPGSQPSRPAGTYTDTLTARLRDGSGVQIATTTFGITVLTTNTCQLSVPPGNVNFVYTSFQAGPANASTSFGVRCTTGIPYTLALDAPGGTLLGLTYTLSIAPSTAGNGTGATQTYSINGTIAGGQGGACVAGVCNGSQTRTLTLSW